MAAARNGATAQRLLLPLLLHAVVLPRNTAKLFMLVLAIAIAHSSGLRTAAEAREERQNAQIAKMMWVVLLLALLGGSAAASQHTAPPSVRVLSSEPPYHLPPPHGGGLSLEATRAYGALALWWSACAHRTAPLPHGWLIEQIKWLMRPLTH